MPPTHINALEEIGHSVKENTRRLSFADKFMSKGTMGEGVYDRPRDFYTAVSDETTPGSEMSITSKSGFHSGGGPGGVGATTPGDTVVHESGHGLHDFISRLKDGKYGFWHEGPRGSKGDSPHKEGVADGYRELYEDPSGPKDPMDPDRTHGYNISGSAWRKDDPVIKHEYETTRLQTMGGSTERGVEGAPEGLGTIEPSSMADNPVMGTLERLLSPDSEYVRTMYGTRRYEGGADLVPELGENTDDGNNNDDTSWTDKESKRSWKTAGRDYADNVLSRVQVGQQRSSWGTSVGTQHSMFPDIAPHVDLRETDRHGVEENQRSGEEHLDRVKSNLKTWLV
jgi:hypothetical protein